MLDSALLQYVPLVCLLIVAGVTAVQPKFTPIPRPDPPSGFVMALELPKRGEVARLLASRDAVAAAHASLDWDRWFIVAYTLLFVSFAEFHVGTWRIAMIAVAIATALCDYWENAVIRSFANAPAKADDTRVWIPAQLKWIGYFTNIALIGALFLRPDAWRFFAAAAMAVAAIGVYATIMRARVAIQRITLVSLLVIVVGVIGLIVLH